MLAWVEILQLIYMCRFPPDDGCFAGTAPSVTTKGTGGLDNTMAGYEESHQVAADGGAYRS